MAKTVETDPLVGRKAPAFSLPVLGGETVSLAKLKSKPFVLYFYPKDLTSGCTTEACSFRDAYPAFRKLGITVIGVSKDSLASHEKFRAAHDLPFLLAADEEAKALEAYGVWKEKSMYGRRYMGIERSTFLIDAGGVVRAVWRKVSVTGHIEQVMQAAKAL